MRVKVSSTDILNLEQNKGKLLLHLNTNKIYLIADFTIEEVEEQQKVKKGFLQPTTTENVKQKYLTAISVHCYHVQGNFVGEMGDDSVTGWFIYRDFYTMRNNWITFKKMLTAFGFDVVPKSDLTLLERAFEAGREYQEYKGNANLEEKSWELTFSKWCEKNNIKNL